MAQNENLPTRRPATAEAAAPHIARIDRLTEAGRVNWFGLMAYLVFAFITVLGVEDADFFIPSRQTHLPLVNVAIPTEAFFYFAPVLGVALYVYLHLYVRKATGALCAAPARVLTNGATSGPLPLHDTGAGGKLTARPDAATGNDGSTPLERHLKPWLLNDMVLRWRGDGAIELLPLNAFAYTTVVLLVWVAGPFVFFGMWVRSWPAHNEYMTTIAGLCLALSLYAGHVSWVRMRRDLKGSPKAFQPRSDLPRYTLLTGLAAGILWLGWTKTESGAPWDDPPEQTATMTGAVSVFVRSLPNVRDPAWWGALTPARLADVPFANLPSDQADPVAARQRYRIAWCDRVALPRAVCGSLAEPAAEPDAVLWSRRAAWCQTSGIDACQDWFAARDADFRAEWLDYRAAVIAALPKPDLRNADLRGADLSRAALIGVTLTGARLDGANLRGAQLERATLTCATAASEFDQIDGRGETFEECARAAASLRGADLAQASLVGAKLAFVDLSEAMAREADFGLADLRHARLSRADVASARLLSANLQYANLERASLRIADLAGADLTGIRAAGADFHGARLAGADLSAAKLQGAFLHGARLPGADLSSAQLSGADLTVARLGGADLWGADLAGASLRGADLSEARLKKARLGGADLINATLAGADLQEATLEGAIALDADFRDAHWTEARLGGLALFRADLRGATGLAQAQLDWAIGSPATLLPEKTTGGAVPRICTCWPDDPPGVADMLASPGHDAAGEAEIRAPDYKLFCASGTPPRRTGTPWPLARPVPWGPRRDGDDIFTYRDRQRAWTRQQPDGGPCPPIRRRGGAATTAD